MLDQALSPNRPNGPRASADFRQRLRSEFSFPILQRTNGLTGKTKHLRGFDAVVLMQMRGACVLEPPEWLCRRFPARRIASLRRASRSFLRWPNRSRCPRLPPTTPARGGVALGGVGWSGVTLGQVRSTNVKQRSVNRRAPFFNFSFSRLTRRSAAGVQAAEPRPEMDVAKIMPWPPLVDCILRKAQAHLSGG